MNEVWPYGMPRKLACKVIEELEWMANSYCLEQFSCDWLIDLCQKMLEEEKGKKSDEMDS